MKKYARWFMILLTVMAMVAVLTVCASAAEPVQEGGHWVINADKIDEILAEEAGEKTTGWEVPFLKVSPTLDGTISKAEYQPFEMYEDYLSYMAVIGNANQGNTKEEFLEFYEMTKNGFFDAYWGWDGRYLYVAFEVRCVNGFNCKPEEMGGNVYLYAYNMLQVGIAPVDATGKDPDYLELGFGVHSETGESLTHTWMGSFYPAAGEDFVGSYDKENQIVVYEARINLQQALKLEDKMVENGDEINFAWLLSVNGATSSVHDYWQVGFCHGIGGQYSHKMNQYFARITFTGKDVQLDPEEIGGVSEEDKLYELVEFVDMSDEKVVKSFTAEGAAIEYITEGGESFARITSLSDIPYVWSKTYPRSLQSAECGYIAVKYRYNGDEPIDLGILYRNAFFPEYDLEYMYTETIGNDGEWHVLTFYMTGEERWQNWIVNMGLAPLAAAGDSVDIAFVKFYNLDPFDLYEDQEFDPNQQKETQPEETTAENTDTAEEATTAAPVDETTVAANTETPTDTEAEKSGCGATLSMGILSVLAMASAVVLKKKED